MSGGFFSLSSGGGFAIAKEDDQEQQQQQQRVVHNHHHHQNQNQDQEDSSIITPNSLYLFKNEEIYSKGFELWQQYYQLHHHRQHHHHHHQPPPQHYDLRRSGVDDLCLNSNNNNSNLYSSSWSNIEGGKVSMRQGGYGIAGDHHGGGSGGGSGSGGGGSGGGMNCQDCGNQAKKDCQHMRCRTCCKSRGFECQTHVKSTWVPAAKRRERQQQLASLTQQQHPHNLGSHHQLSLMMRGGDGGGGGIDQNPKRLREDYGGGGGGGGGGGVVVTLPSSHHHNTSTGLEVGGHFPSEVSSPAVFRCVRVSAMDEAEEQLAYQTAVNIGGHVFKGILYDHGPEGRYNHPGGGDTSSAGGSGQHQQLNLITSGTMGIATTSVNPNVTSSSAIDPSAIYPTPLNAFMAGTQFFPPPRS